jgi:hypothetical protein
VREKYQKYYNILWKIEKKIDKSIEITCKNKYNTMNIFFLHKNISKCALYYFNRHLKIILEITQLLYTSHHILESVNMPENVYKPTHRNHPMTLWVCNSKYNYLYAAKLGLELCKVYTFRYKKIHKCQSHLEWLIDNIPHCQPQQYLPKTFLATVNLPDNVSDVPLCMPKQYHSNDLIKSYRQYIINEKNHVRTKTDKTMEDLIIEWNKEE